MKKSLTFIIGIIEIFGIWAGTSSSAWACDLCSVYSASRAEGESRNGFRGGLAEQFTHFGTLKSDGTTIDNSANQSLNSSITQFFLLDTISERFAVQANFPLIVRSYKRTSATNPSGFDQGTVSGLGDSTLLGKYTAYHRADENLLMSWILMGGVKLPTGSPSRIDEELSESDFPAGIPASGIHGHDLALGTGSLDEVLGTSLDVRHERLIVQTHAQYTFRNAGHLGYRYANDFMWSVGPGYYLSLQHASTLNLMFSASGEIKGLDTFLGRSADDTGVKSIFIGPQLNATLGDKMAAVLALDVPIFMNTTAYQLAPSSRIRANLALQF